MISIFNLDGPLAWATIDESLLVSTLFIEYEDLLWREGSVAADTYYNEMLTGITNIGDEYNPFALLFAE